YHAPQEAWQHTVMTPRPWFALLFTILLSAAPRYPIDWSKHEPEILDHFTTLLRIDTTNPPGNETRAAQAIESILKREGIPAQLLALEPNRATLVARIKVIGAKRPTLLPGHTDVGGVQRGRWRVEPFAAIRKNGLIYARGANDDKDHFVAALMVLLELHRQH